MARFNPPAQPGCYLFKDADGKIIYVGKAKNLRNRVSSYFNNQPKAPKTILLVQNIKDAEFIVVNNEVEALLLENRLIKQHRPQYNIMLKDDKRYAYLLITAEKYPRLITTRNPKQKGRLFGPYTDGFARRDVQDLCQRLFRIRTCTTVPKKVCLMYHLNRCYGPCEGFISKEDYDKNIENAIEVLKGDIAPIVTRLRSQMSEASAQRHYEQAKWCRDAIESLLAVQHKQSVDKARHYDEDAIGLATDGTKTAIVIMHVRKGVITRKSEFVVDHSEEVLSEFLQAYYGMHDPPNRILLPISIEDGHAISIWLSEKRGTSVNLSVPNHGDALSLVEIATKNAQLSVEDVHPGIVALTDALNLPQLPRTIEVFDISTLQGTNTVGAMVQFVNGKPNPSGYRKFIIKKAYAHDDLACMREVVGRRYARLASEGKDFPDLIIIDGGPNQLQVAREALSAIKPTQPIIALAKELEEIFIPSAEQSLRLPEKNPGLLLIRQARDAVHRFVISFHRKRRGKAMVKSALDDIPGIGPSTKNKLLARVGSVAAIRKADLDEIAKCVPRGVAQKVSEALSRN